MDRVIIAVLSFLKWCFRIQDHVATWLGRHPHVSSTPPSAPGAEAALGGAWAYFATAHGRLFHRIWRPNERERPLAAVVAVHGAGAYGGHFWVLGQHLASRGIATFALDLRGHGYSDGPRGDLSEPEVAAQGIVELVRFLWTDYGGRVPVFVLGESVGADLVMVAARLDESRMAGLILCGTAVEPTEETTGLSLLETLREYVRYSPYLLFNSWANVIDITQREERVSRDPESVRRAKVDPLRTNRLSVRTMVGNYLMIKQAYSYARDVMVPSLLIQGGQDLVTRPEAVYRLADALGARDVKVVVFPDAYHGLFFDPDTPKVLDTIAHWLRQRVGVEPGDSVESARGGDS